MRSGGFTFFLRLNTLFSQSSLMKAHFYRFQEEDSSLLDGENTISLYRSLHHILSKKMHINKSPKRPGLYLKS